MNNWDENFRGDGSRGHCPKCNKSFDINHGQTFQTQLLKHYEDNHKEELFAAMDYVDRLFKELKKVGRI